MKKTLLLTVSALLFAYYLTAQTDTTINGVTYTLFAPGLWVELGVGEYRPGTNHCGAPTEVLDVTNPVTGAIWMDRNLGASRVAQDSTDGEAYGDLYQWGRLSDGHQCRNSATRTPLSSTDQPGHGDFIITSNSPFDWRSPQNTNLWLGVNGVNNPCPFGWRVPTEAEWQEELNSWGINTNATGAINSPLKLPMAGYRLLSDGSLILVGTYGGYWSSTVSSTSSRYLRFRSNIASMLTGSRALGYSVRCLKDLP